MTLTEQNALLLLEFIPYTYLLDCKEMEVITNEQFETIKRVEHLVCSEKGVNITDANAYKSAKIVLIGNLIKMSKELRDIKVEQRKKQIITANHNVNITAK
jgi:hypothetical protein